MFSGGVSKHVVPPAAIAGHCISLQIRDILLSFQITSSFLSVEVQSKYEVK
jgi:hypothetical protein